MRPVVLIFSASLLLPVGLRSQSAAPPGLDTLVAKVMADCRIPGLALSVVKDGRTVVARGYGVRKIGTAQAVDANTLFPIASNTKAFTAAAIGQLVDQGKLKRTAPVISYLPWFKMADPWVTREMTVQDLLVHRSGLAADSGDLMLHPASTFTRREIAERVQFMTPATSFRTTYAYTGVMYIVAGELIEAVSGQTWESFIDQHILAPAGMTATMTRGSALATAPNAAAPHGFVSGQVQVVTGQLADSSGPAANISSNASDMAKWLTVLLGRGATPDGARIYSPNVARQMETIVTPESESTGMKAVSSGFNGYATGVHVREYRGHKLLMHTGGVPGYWSRVVWMPDLAFGMAVLTNQESGDALDALIGQTLDQYLGASDVDWTSGLAARASERAGAEPVLAALFDAQRSASVPMSLPLSGYAGTFRDAWYGDVSVAQEPPGLVMRFSRTPVLVGDLEPIGRDRFIVRWRDRTLRADAIVTYATSAQGIDAITMVAPLADGIFDFGDLRLRPKR